MTTRFSGSGAQWALPTKMLFRFAFCYYLLYSLCGGNGSPLAILPGVGNKLDQWLQSPMNFLSLWAGTYIFHLSGREATLHIPATGDGALRWVAAAIMLVLAAVIAIVWSFLDRHGRTTTYFWAGFV